MDLSSVILTWNSAPHIKKCIKSVMEAARADNYKCEVFIVDNGSRDETKSIIHSLSVEFPDTLKIIELNHNYGTTYSRNLALQKVAGQYVAVIDSDIELKGSIFSLLISALESDANVGLAVPRLLYPNGLLQKSTDRFPTVHSKFLRYFFLKRQERIENKKIPEGGEVDYAISAFWVLKREVLNDVGLLDENIFYAPEDVDYCLRMWKAGYRIIFVPEAKAIHHAQEISRGFKINKATFQHIKGLIYYFQKHNCWLVRPSIR